MASLLDCPVHSIPDESHCMLLTNLIYFARLD
jgi:hypothetical protein